MNKVDIAIGRIQQAFELNPRLISGHSGGKDSVVIHDLIDRSGIDVFATIHSPKPLINNCTQEELSTAMYLETLEFLYETVSVERPITILPRYMTQEWLRENEITCQIDGSRLVEYTRTDKSGNIIVDGENVSRLNMTEYVENGIFGLNLCYPIFDWTDEDVFDHITKYNLPISEEYFINGELDAYRKLRNISTSH